MAEEDLRALLERHVELFNEAARSRDFAAFLDTFADNATMHFDDLPLGPFRGRDDIARAYVTGLPADTMALIDMQQTGPDVVRASFEWDAGGTGEMVLRWVDGRVVEATIAVFG